MSPAGMTSANPTRISAASPTNIVEVDTHTSLMSTIMTTMTQPETGPSANVPMRTGTSEKRNSRNAGKANGSAKLKM